MGLEGRVDFPIGIARDIFNAPAFMPSTCKILTTRWEPGDYGGGTPVDSVVSQTRCRLEPGGGSEGVFQDAVRTRTSAVVHLPFGTDVKTHDPETGDAYYLEVDGRRFNIESIAAISAAHSVGPVVAVSDTD